MLHKHLAVLSLGDEIINVFFSLNSKECTKAEEDVHLVTMAEKMQSALLVTAHPAGKARKRKPEAEMAATKKALDKERSWTESTSVRCLRGGDYWGM